MHMIKILTRLGAMALVSGTLLTACKQEQPPNAREMSPQQMEKLTSLAENFDKSTLSKDERTKAGDLFNKLSYEEMEAFIDLRYQQSLLTKDVTQDRATELRDLRHQLNRKAYEGKQKPFQQLDYASSEEVLQSLKPTATRTPTANSASPGGRTAVECITDARCYPWRPTGSIIEYAGANATWIKGTYVGELTLQCSENLYQPDCDYVFRFTYSKLYDDVSWRAVGLYPLVGTTIATKVVDVNPDKVHCGMYIQDLMFGKTRVDWFANGPGNFVQNFLELGVGMNLRQSWCYTGTWGTEKWYNLGVYLAGRDGMGAYWDTATRNSKPPCTCNINGLILN